MESSEPLCIQDDMELHVSIETAHNVQCSDKSIDPGIFSLESDKAPSAAQCQTKNGSPHLDESSEVEGVSWTSNENANNDQEPSLVSKAGKVLSISL